MSINNKFYDENISRIESIEFSIYGNKLVEQYSVVSEDPDGIVLPESYENYEPIKGGIVDLRLGTCDIYLPCTTCGENSLDCPGHFGHTKLTEPVFHYGFLNHLKNILKCICLKCSILLIEKNDALIKKLSNKSPENRFKEIQNMTKHINYCYQCGVPVPKIKREVKDSGTLKIILERAVSSSTNTDVDQNLQKKLKETLIPRDCYHILRNISNMDCFLLGMIPKLQRPEDMIIEKFPIPPVIIRPSAKVDFISSAKKEDALTHMISTLLVSNKRLKTQLEKDITASGITSYKQDLFNLLQYHVAIYFDNESLSLPRTEFKTGYRNVKSISERIKGKAGRIRNNLMGKRVDFSARTVITPDPYINIDQVGIPRRIATELTVPEEVTSNNIKYLSGLVKNGRYIYPGANFVLKTNYTDGKVEIQKIDLRYRKKDVRLNYGDVVERHCINGDYVLFNRQPTLHKPSMMGHRIHVIDNDNLNTFRINVSVCKPYGADFDGDEMNIHLGQSIQAKNEIKMLANVKYQMISPKNSSPIIGCQQDTVSGGYMLTEKNVIINGREVANMLCSTTSISKTDIELNKNYTGHEIFSHIIPKKISSIKEDKGTIVHKIVNGIMLEGNLDKSLISFSKNSLIHFIWDKYNPDTTQKFIDNCQRLVLSYLLHYGQTIKFDDVLIDKNIYNKIETIINAEILQSKYDITQYENNIYHGSLDTIETKLTEKLNVVLPNISKIIISHYDSSNFFWVSANSGAKGSMINLGQMLGLLGQQMLSGARIRKNIEGRSMIYFHKGDDTPEARGFIKSSYLKGLKPYEFFINSIAGREGLIDTAIKSVSWDTEILLYNNSNIILTTIGKWIDNLLIKNKDKVNYEINYDTESLDIDDDNSTYILSSDINGNISWKIIKSITRHNPTDIIFTVKTKSGRSVTVTNTKSLLVCKQNEHSDIQILEEHMNNIKLNDCLPILYKSVKNININTILDLRTYKINLTYDYGKFIGLYLNNGLIIYNYIKIKDSNLLNINFIYDWLVLNCIWVLKINSLELNIYDIKLLNHIKSNEFINTILNSPLDVIKGFLQGYLTGDNIQIINNKLYIILDTLHSICNNNITNNIIFLLSQLSIFCCIEDSNIFLTYEWAIKLAHILELPELLQLILDNIKEEENNTYVVHNDIVLDPIISIISDKSTATDKMYDLTIPETFNFGLANGLQVRDTAQTGYIQRQLIKGLEDLSIKYDGTMRNAKGVIIQTVYADSGIDQSTQTQVDIKLLTMNNKKIYDQYSFTEDQLDKLHKLTSTSIDILKDNNDAFILKMINFRDELRIIQKKALNNYKTIETKYQLPVNLLRITQSYNNNKELVELDPEYILNKIEHFITAYDNRLIVAIKETDKYIKNDDRQVKFILEIALYEYLAPKKCIFQYGLSKIEFDNMFEEITLNFIKAIVEVGEMVGIIAAQSIGEPTSQMNLNTKHFAGIASKGSSNMGVPRIQELLHYSKNIKNPEMTVYFEEPYRSNRNLLNKIISYFRHLTINDLINSIEIYYDPGLNDTLSNKLKQDNVNNPFYINNQKIEMYSMPFVFRLVMNINKMIDKEITMIDIKSKFISHWYKNYNNLKTLKKNERDIISKISTCAIYSNNPSEKENIIHIRFNMNNFNNTIILDFLKMITNDITLKGIENITDMFLPVESTCVEFNKETGDIIQSKEFVVTTTGINLEKLRYIKGIDSIRTICNDINTIYKLYGIEAARQILLYELNDTYQKSDINININHLTILVDQMCYTGDIISIDRHGLSKIEIDTIARASFEKSMDHFINAAIFNETDKMNSTSSRIAVGRVIPGGTGCFELLLDTQKIENSEYTENEKLEVITFRLLEEESLIKDIITYDSTTNNFYNPLLNL